MSFELSGSLIIPKKENGLINSDKGALREFWSYVDESYGDSISCAVGCYVYSIRAGKGILPWYVGLAEKQVFSDECFSTSKLNYYNDAIAARKGTPELFLIIRTTEGGKISKPTVNEYKDVQTLESMLIKTCIDRNPELYNIKETKYLREMVVPGYLNNPKGRDTKRIKELQEILIK